MKKIKIRNPNFIETDVLQGRKQDIKDYSNSKFLHICEKCGRQDILTPQKGFELGWDYPPKMSDFKMVSPRTCGDCGIEHTIWWDICLEHKNFEELTEAQHKTIARILQEPDSIIVKDEENIDNG